MRRRTICLPITSVLRSRRQYLAHDRVSFAVIAAQTLQAATRPAVRPADDVPPCLGAEAHKQISHSGLKCSAAQCRSLQPRDDSPQRPLARVRGPQKLGPELIRVARPFTFPAAHDPDVVLVELVLEGHPQRTGRALLQT